MHKSFPYAPCINTSQPSDLLYTCNNPRSLSSHSHNLIAHMHALLSRSDVTHPCSPLRCDLSGQVHGDVISPARLHGFHSLAPTWFSPLLALRRDLSGQVHGDVKTWFHWRGFTDFSSEIHTAFWRGNHV